MNLELIKTYVELRRIPFKTLAASIGMSEGNLHRCVRENKIQASDLEKIAIKLEVPIGEFFDEAPCVHVEAHDHSQAAGRDINNGSSKASKLDSVADGNYIKMARDNEASLAIDNYSGNITVFYENSGTEAVGGDITIGNAAEGSEITLVTSNGSKYFAAPSEDGTNNTDIFKLKALMNDLAEKLTYNAYVEGERNLTGSVQIAEGLTTASATLVVGDIGFNESTGKGSLVEESMDPETVYPDEQTGTKFTTQLNGVVEDDIKFVQNGILDIDNPGIYDITKATTITQDGDNVTFTVTDTEISTKGEKRGIISSAGDDTTVTLNLHGNTLQLGEKKSARWW